MAKDNQINVKVNDPTDEAIEQFAEKHDYTKAEAVRRMVEDRLTGEGYLSTGQPLPDGGAIQQDIDELQSEVNDLNDQSRQSTFLNYLLVVSVVWLGLEVTVGLPSFVVILTGPLIILAIFYLWFEQVIKV